MLRVINKDALMEAINLIVDTYNKTEAKNDLEEGRGKFYQEFCSYENISKRLNRDLFMIGYYNDEELAGVISVDDTGYIMHLFIKYNMMGKGIASALIEAVEDYLRKHGFKYSYLDSSVYARGFYKNLGYLETDGLIESDGMKYIPMKKLL